MRTHRSVLPVLSLGLLGCTMLHASKTPQGVDVTPVYALQLNGDLKDLDAMAKL